MSLYVFENDDAYLSKDTDGSNQIAGSEPRTSYGDRRAVSSSAGFGNGFNGMLNQTLMVNVLLT